MVLGSSLPRFIQSVQLKPFIYSKVCIQGGENKYNWKMVNVCIRFMYASQKMCNLLVTIVEHSGFCNFEKAAKNTICFACLLHVHWKLTGIQWFFERLLHSSPEGRKVILVMQKLRNFFHLEKSGKCPRIFDNESDEFINQNNSNLCLGSFWKTSYSGPRDLRPPIQPAKYGLKLKVVLK